MEKLLKIILNRAEGNCYKHTVKNDFRKIHFDRGKVPFILFVSWFNGSSDYNQRGFEQNRN